MKFGDPMMNVAASHDNPIKYGVFRRRVGREVEYLTADGRSHRTPSDNIAKVGVNPADTIEALLKALEDLVNARAISGVREIVAGWNGENKPDGPYQRHPSKLGATLPKTTCGAVYDLDEAMQRAHAALAKAKS